MSKSNRSYTNEFIREAIKLALDSPSITNTAKNLGIPIGTLHTWIRNAKKSGEQPIISNNKVINNINVSEVLDENKELKRKVARLEQEKAILKKAATYFAAELQ